MSQAACCLILALFGQETTVPDVAAPRTETPPIAYELEVHEFFSSKGAEPSYWAAFSRSVLDRRVGDSGVVDFSFDLREIATVLGAERRVRFDLDQGVDRLTIQQDAATDIVHLGGESPLTDFLNANVASLDRWKGSWSNRLALFNASVVPGVASSDVDLSCTVEKFETGQRSYLLYRYSTAAPHRFTIGGAAIEMSYSGLAVVDPSLQLPLVVLFEQVGTVQNGELRSDVEHRFVGSLQDPNRAEPVLDPPAWLLNRINAYRFHKRQPDRPLDPTLATNDVRPPWSVALWLSGRVADLTMTMVAERGTNPLPVASLGSLVLTDQAISYGGTRYLEQRRIDLGQDHPDAPRLDRVASPIERAYGEARFGERLALLGDRTSGVMRIHGEETTGEDDDSRAIVIGVLSLAGGALLQDDGDDSRLKFATAESASAIAGTSAWGVVTATGLGGAAAFVGTGVIIAIIGGVAAVDAVTGGTSSPGTPPPTPYTVLALEEVFNGGCNEGFFVLRIVDEQPGRSWMLSAVGTRTAGPTCSIPNTNWNESTSGTTQGTQELVLRITAPPHVCLNGTVTVTVNGAPATFNFAGSAHSGGVSSSCF